LDYKLIMFYHNFKVVPPDFLLDTVQVAVIAVLVVFALLPVLVFTLPSFLDELGDGKVGLASHFNCEKNYSGLHVIIEKFRAQVSCL